MGGAAGGGAAAAILAIAATALEPWLRGCTGCGGGAAGCSWNLTRGFSSRIACNKAASNCLSVISGVVVGGSSGVVVFGGFGVGFGWMGSSMGFSVSPGASLGGSSGNGFGPGGGSGCIGGV